MGASSKTTSTNNLPMFQRRSKVRKTLDTTIYTYIQRWCNLQLDLGGEWGDWRQLNFRNDFNLRAIHGARQCSSKLNGNHHGHGNYWFIDHVFDGSDHNWAGALCIRVRE